MAKLKSGAKARAGRTSAGPKAAGSGSEGLQDKAEALSRSIMDSAQQIWLAGMGAFGRAQEEGTRMFEALVSEGMSIEKVTRKLAGGRVDAVRGAVESKVGQVRERATDTWDRLEKVFEERVQRALVRLGVPGREELQALIERVDRLNAELRRLSAKAPAPDRPATRARSAAKPVAKRKPVVRKAAAKKAPRKRAPLKDATE